MHIRAIGSLEVGDSQNLFVVSFIDRNATAGGMDLTMKRSGHYRFAGLALRGEGNGRGEESCSICESLKANHGVLTLWVRRSRFPI